MYTVLLSSVLSVDVVHFLLIRAFFLPQLRPFLFFLPMQAWFILSPPEILYAMTTTL